MIFALVDTWHQLPSISHQLLSTGKSLAININHVPLPRQFVGPDARIISGKNITWAICDLWDLQGASGLKCNDRAHFIGGPTHYQLEDASESKYPFPPKSPVCASFSEYFVGLGDIYPCDKYPCDIYPWRHLPMGDIYPWHLPDMMLDLPDIW